MKKELRIVLTGGGSGGHIDPLLAVAERLKVFTAQASVFLELHYMGPFDKMTQFFLSDKEVKIHPLVSSKFRRYFSFSNFLDIPKFFISLIQAWFKLFFLMPDVIFSKGGPGALPVVLTGWFYRIPIIIHESDSVPGLTNLVSGRFAKRIAIAFERAGSYFSPGKTAWIGTPVRKAMEGDRLTKEVAKEYLKFSQDYPLVLILGGSQGARSLNEFILTNLETLSHETQILHQTGAANYDEVEKLARAALNDFSIEEKIRYRYYAVPFLDEDDLKHALTAADVVIARAGSGTINIIAAFGKPCILVPLPNAAGDHQQLNAYEFAKGGGGVVIEEKNLFPAIFSKQLEEMMTSPGALTRMGSASHLFFKPGAAEILAEEILKITGFLK